jgi:cyclopropane-fatty-acyl-phospholipid synthase
VLWNGAEVTASSAPPVARVHIYDRVTLIKLVMNPNLYFGDAYSQGHIHVEGNLLELLETVYRSIAAACAGGGLGARILGATRRARPNSMHGSRDNIHRHYDVGNDFYRLWLDEQMLYTCAYFPTPAATLEQAQIAKMDHVCRKLQLKPGEQVVEAGCGWGALALHMARRYGVKVKAYNVSHQQIVYSRERARAEGLDGQVEFIEDDYRTIAGRYDAFVSVGMLEHVGVDNYRTLGDVIQRVLKESGRGLIHTIGRNRAQPMNAWIEKRIFPGAYPPTLHEMMAIFEPHQFSVLDVENLRLHYAQTLEHWLWRFEKAAERIGAMFDESFVRAWRLYLAGSWAAFTTSDLQLFQVLFAPHTNNDLAWTRAHLYR